MRNKIFEIITIKVYKKGIYILLSGWKCTKEHEESRLGTDQSENPDTSTTHEADKRLLSIKAALNTVIFLSRLKKIKLK